VVGLIGGGDGNSCAEDCGELLSETLAVSMPGMVPYSSADAHWLKRLPSENP
jgi:hypothetical protein